MCILGKVAYINSISVLNSCLLSPALHSLRVVEKVFVSDSVVRCIFDLKWGNVIE